MSNYNERNGTYSSGHDYLFSDNLKDSSFAILSKSDLKNMKIKILDGSTCQVMYIPAYGLQAATILTRILASKISETKKLILEVHDTTLIT